MDVGKEDGITVVEPVVDPVPPKEAPLPSEPVRTPDKEKVGV